MRPLPVSGGSQRESGTFFFNKFLNFLGSKGLLSRILSTYCFILIDFQNEKSNNRGPKGYNGYQRCF